MQWGVHDTAARTAETVREYAQPVPSPEEYNRLAREREALRHEVTALAGVVSQLQQQVQAVAGFQKRGLLGAARLIPARVVSADAVAWRESIQIDRGADDGVRTGDWVVSCAFPSSSGESTRLDDAVQALLSQTLLGQVAETAPLTSRAVLLSDPYSQAGLRVRIARIERGRLVGPDSYFMLQGVGRGRMAVREVDARLLAGDQVRESDLVVSSPGDPRLPIAMVIGEVDRIDRHPKNPLLHDLTIRPRLDLRAVRQVYVVSTASEKE